MMLPHVKCGERGVHATGNHQTALLLTPIMDIFAGEMVKSGFEPDYLRAGRSKS